MSLLVVLALALALNVIATRRLLLLGERFHMGRMFIAVVWIAPFFGALLALMHTAPAMRALRSAAAQPAAAAREPAPHEVLAPDVLPFPVREHLRQANGFALLDWRAATAWLDTIADSHTRAAARADLQAAWLAHLGESIHESFQLHESEDALILSSLDRAEVAAMARYVSMARKRIAQTLGGLVRFPEGMRSVVLVLDDEDWYYHYISIYYPAGGEFALSGGMFVDAGCPHFIVRRDELRTIEPTIAHELTHSALAHLSLPRWLDEGLAVNTEHKIAGAHRGLHTPRQLHEKHRAFWNDELIQAFWSGESFFRTDDGNLLSYDLARIMVAQMGRSWPAFEQFATHARRDDAGAAAARDHMALDLGAYASLIVERDPSEAWTPAIAAEDEPAEAASSPSAG
jgi:hypothetical protein